MMIAKKSYKWGMVEVRFEVKEPPDFETGKRILAANEKIIEILNKLAEQAGGTNG